ncbi:unnamed protein product [Cylicostephanus goldi]|uniref:Adenosine kinase n=1 Tax=Cylicostephanus goldi TaxID=71465 RepID=A0A3P7N2R9_CYLGO|nr:unnamed protein product [Cylicostephanus goldi]
MHIAKHSHESNKIFMFNLAAPFISQFFFEPLKEVLPYVDVIFGNEDEASAFSKAANFGTTNNEEIAVKIALWDKVSQRKRIVVITQGADSVIVAVGDKTTLYPVPKIAKEKIVDTNGAGDAFVGGQTEVNALWKFSNFCVQPASRTSAQDL